MSMVLSIILQSRARYLLLALLVALMAYSFPSAIRAAPSDPGQALFEQKCKSCHSIGGGKVVGPDLKGVTTQRDRSWVLKTITAPDQLIAQGDAQAKQLVQEYGMPMPNLGVSAQDAEKIVAYIEAQSGDAGGQTPAQGGPVASTGQTAIVGDAALGRGLFTGSVRFTNGAAACISCHDVKGVGALGGGSVGKDLTPAYTNFGPDGLKSLLQTAPFPIMREAFADHPLTDSEVADLLAFLQEASAQNQQAQNSNLLIFSLIGLIGFVPIMGLFHFAWRGRLQGVRKLLVKGGSK